MDFIGVLLNGLAIGALYALFATGYALSFSVLGIVNFAHGAFVTLGAYLALYFLELKLPFLLAALFSLLFCALSSAFLYLVFFRRVQRNGKSFMPLALSLGLASVLSNLILIIFGSETKSFPPQLLELFPTSLTILGTEVRFFQVAIFGTSAGVFALLGAFLKFTLAGRALFAVAENEEMATLLGLDAQSIKVGVFLFSGLLAGVCGILFALNFGISGPYFGLAFGLKGLAVLVAGGLGSMRGALAAGTLIGCIESAVPPQLSGYREAIAFAILFLFLVYRPRGIFGRALADRV